MQKLTILGATGSIGVNTLDVIRRHPEKYEVFALTAHKNVALLKAQCIQYQPQFAVVNSDQDARVLQQELRDLGVATDVLSGPQALVDVASHDAVDGVMAAIVGAAGLASSYAAASSGKRVLLANKEALVMSGQLFIDAVRASGAELLPIDSEHNAIFQCLPRGFSSLEDAGVSKILLTGSGGPFRSAELGALTDVTPEQACAHPNWSMGKKISVDSATMMNKGLEFIEACWLFGAGQDDIEVVVHPQSIVHSMVQYCDGSVIAQLGQPDMRTPIANCLGWPERIDAGVKPLDFTSLAGLSFEAPDFERFPCLKSAISTFGAGKDYSVVLNAANEIAVDLFLRKALKFTDISAVIADVIEKWDCSEPDSIDAVIESDQRARALTILAAKNYW